MKADRIISGAPAPAHRPQEGAAEELSPQQRIDNAEHELYNIAAVLVALCSMGAESGPTQSIDLGDAIERLATDAHERLLSVISELVG